MEKKALRPPQAYQVACGLPPSSAAAKTACWLFLEQAKNVLPRGCSLTGFEPGALLSQIGSFLSATLLFFIEIQCTHHEFILSKCTVQWLSR